MNRILFLIVVLFPSSSCYALYECQEHGRVILSSAPCDATFVPLSRYQYSSPSPVNPPAVPVAGSVQIRLDSSNSYTLQGTVRGVPAVYYVDTGASYTAISSRVAANAGLSGCAASFVTHTANGSLQVCRVMVSEITFGPFKLADILVTVMPSMQQDVLLGMDVLRNLKLDQRAGILRISN